MYSILFLVKRIKNNEQKVLTGLVAAVRDSISACVIHTLLVDYKHRNKQDISSQKENSEPVFLFFYWTISYKYMTYICSQSRSNSGLLCVLCLPLCALFDRWEHSHHAQVGNFCRRKSDSTLNRLTHGKWIKQAVYSAILTVESYRENNRRIKDALHKMF